MNIGFNCKKKNCMMPTRSYNEIKKRNEILVLNIYNMSCISLAIAHFRYNIDKNMVEFTALL